MKKVKHLIFCASAFLLVTVPAFAAKTSAAAGSKDGICSLITEFKSIFALVRTLAFVGAGFILAKYAWNLISKGDMAGKGDGKTDLTTELKTYGLPMIIGFVLLFAIGAILTGLLRGDILCKEVITGKW